MNRKKHVVIWIGMLSLVFIVAIYGQIEQTEIPQDMGEAALSYRGAPDPEELAAGALSKKGTSGLGLTSIDGDELLRFQLQPEIDLGKVGLGLNAVLMYNFSAAAGEYTILAKDGETWDGIRSILRFVSYVRYGSPRAPFYTRFGALDYVTIGHGFIMSGYSNHDRRGLNLNLNTPTKGIEIVLNNLTDPTVFGGRLFVRPLKKESGGMPILNNLEFGATYLTDTDPNQIPDDEQVPETTDEDALIAFGADVGIPLINNQLLRLDIYDDVAFMNTKPKANEPAETDMAIEPEPVGTEMAMGNAVGLGLSVSQVFFKLEYRNFGEGFYPTIFDYTYEAAKDVGPNFLGVDEDDDLEMGENDEEGKPKRGYFSMLAVSLGEKIDFLAIFEDYTTTEPRLYAGITESGLVGRLSFRAFYVKRNIGEPDPGFPEQEGSEDPSFFRDLFRLDSKSAFLVRIGYEILPKFEVAIIREYRFQQGEDAAGERRFEPIQKTSVEVGFKLNF